MNKFLTSVILILFSCSSPEEKSSPTIPGFLIGDFEDDYGVTYAIRDSVFMMEDHTKIHILDWNLDGQLFVGKNDSSNIYDPLLYSRIDWMKFENMGEFEWGFCLSAYNEISLDSARAVSVVNRENPKTGCNGYPFSRMKRLTN
ncbi:MAG: hypothetical protein ACMZ7B_04200 [Balneola sp.]